MNRLQSPVCHSVTVVATVVRSQKAIRALENAMYQISGDYQSTCLMYIWHVLKSIILELSTLSRHFNSSIG